jgi:hypothetical protein
VSSGDLVALVAGVPYFVLTGPLPLYRDLRADDRGDDVIALQRALNTTGADIEESGSIDWATLDAVSGLFDEHDLVLPEAVKEKVIPIKEGDALALPFGAVTWWHNAQDSSAELVVLFLGDTSKGHVPGKFTNFQLTGATGIFTGFSTEFVARAWDLDQDSAAKLVSTQLGSGIVKLASGHKMPEPRPEDREGMVLNCFEAPLDVDIKGGGRVVVLNTANLPLVKEVGLGADLVRIDGHSMCSPGFSCDSAYQVTYIVRGSGRVQVVGIDGTRVLETRAEGGCLFIVPRFFVVSKIADETGMEWFSIITTPK